LGKSCPDLIITSGGKQRWSPTHGRWYVRYEAPRSADGKRTRPRLGPFDTAKEATEAVTEVLGRARTYGHVTDRKITVAEFLDRRLEWWTPEWKPRTLHDAKIACDLYWKPGLGHLRLADLTEEHVRDVHAAMRRINRDESNPSDTLRRLIEARAEVHGQRWNRRPVGEARIQRVTAVLVTALNTKAAKKILPVNPAAGIGYKVDKVKPMLWTDERIAKWKATGKRPSPVMVGTQNQAGRFLDHVEDDRLYPLWHLATYWGLRRGELVALDWSDVRLDVGTVTVRNGKTDSSDRTIRIDAETARVLKQWRKAQLAEHLAWGPGYVDSGRVFTREDGTELPANYVSYRFERLVTDAGLPPVRFHDLRHGAATMLLAAGAAPKVVQETLGHASVAFTSDVYAVVAEELAERAAQVISAFIPRGASK
jgi:integrase